MVRIAKAATFDLFSEHQQISMSDSTKPSKRPIDILVLGNGMAGAFAALAAKTTTNSVAIVEPSNVLGGQGIAGGVAGFCGDS